MKDIILTLVLVFIIYKIVSSFRNGSGPGPGNNNNDTGSGGKEGEMHIDYIKRDKAKKSQDDEGYTDYEEIK